MSGAIVLVRALRDSRRSAAWWALGMVALVAFTVAFYPSVRDNPTFDELIEDLPEAMRALVGVQDGIPLTSPPGYLHGRLYAVMVPVLLLTFGIGHGAKAIGGSEADGTLELLLANPVTRRRVVAERYATLVLLLAGIAGVLTLSLLVLGPLVGLLDGVGITRLLSASAAAFCIALLHTTLAFAVGAATGRPGPAVALATAAASAGYLLQSLTAASDRLRSLEVLSPWHWYLDRNVLAEGVAPAAVAVPLVGAAVLFAVAAWRFDRRDLR
jgi:ABC-2 type transport system permease protein